MKLILTGATGFIGTEVLAQALANPHITSIVALSRKPIPGFESEPKVTIVIIDDFLVYAPGVLSLLEGAGACIWMIGAKALTDPELTQRVTVDYAMAAAKAFTTLNPSGANEGGKKFRFIQTSGRVSEADRGKKLLLFAEARYISGSIETQLLDYADETEGFEAVVLKPAVVLAEGNAVGTVLMSVLPSIRRKVLVAAMLEIALNGYQGEGRKVLDNSQLVKFGSGVLSKQKGGD